MTVEDRATEAPVTRSPAAFPMVIGGEHVAAADGQEFEVVNPADGLVIASAPLGGAEDVDRAVTAARRAFHEPTEAPFGGYEMSDVGRELGMHALEMYTHLKNVFIDLS